MSDSRQDHAGPEDADARIAQAERELATHEARRATLLVMLVGPVLAAVFWIRRLVVTGDPRPSVRVWLCLVISAVGVVIFAVRWWLLRIGRASPRIALRGSPEGDEWFSLTPSGEPELHVSFDVDGDGFAPVVVAHRERQLATLRRLGPEDEELLLPDRSVLRLRAVRRGWRLRLEVEHEGRALEPCSPPRLPGK